MVFNSYVISITEFGYFFFNCRYLKVAMYCFVGNKPIYNNKADACNCRILRNYLITRLSVDFWIFVF